MTKVFCEESSMWGGGRCDDQMIKLGPILTKGVLYTRTLPPKQASDPQSQHTSAGQCGSLHSSYLLIKSTIS